MRKNLVQDMSHGILLEKQSIKIRNSNVYLGEEILVWFDDYGYPW